MKILLHLISFACFIASGGLATAISYSEMILADAPIHFWRLSESNTAEPARDIIGDNHGRYAGDVMLGVRGAIENDFSTASSFNGIDQFIVATNPFAQGAIADFSIEFWMKTTMRGNSDAQHAAFLGNGLLWSDVFQNANDWSVNLLGDRVAFFDGSLADSDVHRTLVSSSAVNQGEWVHVVVIREAGKEMKMYINGHEENSRPCGSAVLDGQADFYFASNFGDNRYFEGSLDEVAIYDKILSPWQIQDHYNARTNSPPGIVTRFEPRGDNVSPGPLIEVVLDTSRVAVNPRSIRVDLDGVPCVPALSDENGNLIISYEPKDLLEPGSIHTANIVFATATTPPSTNVFSYDFKISSHIGITR